MLVPAADFDRPEAGRDRPPTIVAALLHFHAAARNF
jgi:hypothetical protein